MALWAVPSSVPRKHLSQLLVSPRHVERYQSPKRYLLPGTNNSPHCKPVTDDRAHPLSLCESRQSLTEPLYSRSPDTLTFATSNPLSVRHLPVKPISESRFVRPPRRLAGRFALLTSFHFVWKGFAMLSRLRLDEHGFVVSAELMLVITMTFCAAAVGWASV